MELKQYGRLKPYQKLLKHVKALMKKRGGYLVIGTDSLYARDLNKKGFTR